MDECGMHSGFAELEQLHVEPNSEHSTFLHRSSILCRRQKAGQDLETRLVYEQIEPSRLSVLEQLLVESNSDCS